MRPPPLAAYALLSASMVLTGSYVGLSRLLVAAFPVFLLAWLRFAIAAVAMLPWTPREPGQGALSPAQHRLLFLMSFLGNFGFSICMLFGVALTSALAAGVTLAGIPGAVALLSWGFLGERLRPRDLAAIALAAAGVALLAWARGTGAGSAGEESPWGYLLLLGSVFCEASYVVIGKRLSAGLSARRIGALINLWGLALVTPFGLWQAAAFDFAAVGAGTWALLVFYALAASVLSVWLWIRGLLHVPASQAGVFMVLLPITAAAVGALVLGETVGALHGVALALALGGVLLVTWPGPATANRRSSGGTVA